MAENEGMEGKDLAQEEKKAFNEKVLEEIAKLKNNEPKKIIGEMEAIKYGEQTILKVKGKAIAIVSGNTINYNIANFEALKQQLAEEGQTLDDLVLPDLQDEIDKLQKQASEQEAQKEEEKSQKDDGEEIDEEEKDDEKPELEDDKDEKKEEIAKKYSVKASDVIHISKDEKITENDKFQGLARWAKNYDEVYILPGEDPYSQKFVGEKDGEQEEIETGIKKFGGKNPDVKVKRIDGDNISEIEPLSIYEIDSESAIAIVRDSHGDFEALYCRQEEGNEKAYWGSVIPEASGKNVLQQEPEIRDFMDYKYNSGIDLAEKSDALARQAELEERGLPSDEEGVQVEEIQGNKGQNIELNIEKIAEDLMKKDGILDRATVPPGYYEHKAEKVLKIMEANENITYEQAVEQIEKQAQREEGGRAQGEAPNDPRRG